MQEKNTQNVLKRFVHILWTKQIDKYAHMVHNRKHKECLEVKTVQREKIGQTLRTLRGNRSREEVAEALKISKSALAMYERGERVPRDEVKLRIATYFHVPLESIFFYPN